MNLTNDLKRMYCGSCIKNPKINSKNFAKMCKK